MILAHIVLFILCFNHWYQVLTYVAPIILALALWFESDRQKIRLVTILSDTLWLIYNFLVGLYILVITRVIMITVALVAYKKYANKQKVINDAG